MTTRSSTIVAICVVAVVTSGVVDNISASAPPTTTSTPQPIAVPTVPGTPDRDSSEFPALEYFERFYRYFDLEPARLNLLTKVVAPGSAAGIHLLYQQRLAGLLAGVHISQVTDVTAVGNDVQACYVRARDPLPGLDSQPPSDENCLLFSSFVVDTDHNLTSFSIDGVATASRFGIVTPSRTETVDIIEGYAYQRVSDDALSVIIAVAAPVGRILVDDATAIYVDPRGRTILADTASDFEISDIHGGETEVGLMSFRDAAPGGILRLEINGLVHELAVVAAE